MDNNQEKNQERSQEEMVKGAVEAAKKAAEQENAKSAEDAEGAGTSETKETSENADKAAGTEEKASETPRESGEASENEEAEGNADSSEDTDEGEKTGKLFGRKNKKDKKDEKIEELTDKLTRQMAEFDNFRKRTEREKSQMYEIGARDIIEKILPVVDNFERGLGAMTEEEKENPFAQGMDKIYKQLMTTLEEIGVKPIEAVGQEFNPDFHNAVMHVDDESFGENVVAEEFQKGYMYRDSVVRHSMVKVAN